MNVKKIITTKKIKEKVEEPEEELETTPESAEGEEPTPSRHASISIHGTSRRRG